MLENQTLIANMSRVSEEERRVIWCVANQNNFLALIQILVFMTLFGFVLYYFDKVLVVPDTTYMLLNLFVFR